MSASNNISVKKIVSFCVGLSVAVLLGASGCQKSPVQTVARADRIPSTTIKVSPGNDLFPPILHSDDWEKPVPMSGPINTSGAEDSPFISPDGNTLYFFFTPDPNIAAEKQLSDDVTGIYVTNKIDGTWSEPTRVVLKRPGEVALDGCEFVSGDTMWFCSAREGYVGINLFTSKNINNEWRSVKYVGDKLMNEYQVGEMHITADGSEMYFHSTRAGGIGQLDIWETKKINGEWQPPENVSIFNSVENDGWPFVSEDGKEFWFLRTHKGTPAIFRSINLEGVWQQPELILSQFAGEPTLDRAGNLYFVHHYYENGKMIEADIYVAKKKH